MENDSELSSPTEHEAKVPQQTQGFFSLAKGLAVASHITGYIIGPLLLFGGAGWYLDKRFETYPILMIVSIFIAFIVTNVLIFKKAGEVVKSYALPKEKKVKEVKK